VISEHHLSVQRTARYFCIGTASAQVRELWMVCHGYGQLAAQFAGSFEPIAAPSRLVVVPEALSRFYLDRTPGAADPPPRVGATWMTREDRESEIADHVAYLDELHEAVRSQLDPLKRSAASDHVRLRVLGFSQGVATVGRWMAYGRARADDIMLWAGSFPQDIELAPLSKRLGSAPVTLVVGARDELASWANAETQLQRFLAAGIAARLISFEGGHRLDAATLTSLATSWDARVSGA
jgi:predicted esterase